MPKAISPSSPPANYPCGGPACKVTLHHRSQPQAHTHSHLIFSASKSLCGGRLNFFLLANQSFCRRQGHGWKGEGGGLATSRIMCPLTRQHTPWYQAHAGLDAVIVNAWDHLQGDGVLAGLHVVHLHSAERRSARSGPASPNPDTGRTGIRARGRD